VNYPLPVEVAVTKVWDITTPGGEAIDTTVDVTIRCVNTLIDNPVNRTFRIDPEDYVNGAATVKTMVVPGFARKEPPIFVPTLCWATENASTDNAVEVENGCVTGNYPDGNYLPALTVSAGNGASCTITNTVFFEGIPTLSQWGMAIMALLMLGVGLVGFRRFV
jgi:hypothetical protein